MSRIIDATYRESRREPAFTVRIAYGRESLKLYAIIGGLGFAFLAYQNAISRFGDLPVHAVLGMVILILALRLANAQLAKRDDPSLDNQERILWQRMRDPRTSATAVSALSKQLATVQHLRYLEGGRDS